MVDSQTTSFVVVFISTRIIDYNIICINGSKSKNSHYHRHTTTYYITPW